MKWLFVCSTPFLKSLTPVENQIIFMICMVQTLKFLGPMLPIASWLGASPSRYCPDGTRAFGSVPV